MHSSHGPTFGFGSGYHDIHISNNALFNQGSYCACGQTYSVPSGYSAGDCGFFTGGYNFTATDIEVFYEIGNSQKYYYCLVTQKEFLNFKKSEKLKQSYIEDHQSVMYVATIAFLPFFRLSQKQWRSIQLKGG